MVKKEIIEFFSNASEEFLSVPKLESLKFRINNNALLITINKDMPYISYKYFGEVFCLYRKNDEVCEMREINENILVEIIYCLAEYFEIDVLEEKEP